jgi:NADPH:quinone reductase-like Zn-dependent oxidoreductase
MLVQSVTKAGLGSRPRLWVVTSGAQPAGTTNAVEVAQSPMWGLGKGIAIEHPELRCCRIDLSGNSDQVEIAALVQELRADGADDQVALRGSERFVARLLPQLAGAAAEGVLTVAQATADGTSFRVSLARGEQASTAALLGAERRAPAEGEIEIRVATAVVPAGAVQASRNAGSRAHQDVLANQHAGRVVRVGPGVSRFQVGDQVLALQTGAVRSHIVTSVGNAVPLSAAATGAVKPYLTATLAMQSLAGVNRSSCVFVNGADGVLGQAVVQVAKALGARIFLSASQTATLERADELGAIHAFDLSDPSFIDQLRALRGEKGVDVFVNCVPGYDLGRCAPALSPFGRCLDMAGCDAASAGDASRLRLPGNATLQSVDVDGLAAHDADLLATLLEEVGGKLASGAYRALPQQTVALEQLADAVYGGSVTQLAVALPQPERIEVDEARAPFRADASYLITGGLGGLGLSVARRMAQRGARHLVLAGRSAPNLAALDAIAEMEQLGVECQTVALDVADGAQLAQVLARIANEMPPLRGVMHAAGTLDNGLLIQLTKEQFASVAQAKVLGAWNLHQQLAKQPLDFFVMFSSLASAIGSPGQSNYSAANAFLDGLAEHRKAQGQAGLSVGWGPWAEVGMASSVHTLDKLAEHGMGMVPLAAGLNLLEDLVAEGRQGAMAVLPMNWARWGESFPLAGALPYFSELVPQGGEGGAHSQARITADMLQQMGEEAQIEVLQATVHRAVCQAMRIDGEGLDVNTPLTAAGLDSILALELKSRIEAGIDVVVQTYALLKGQTVRGLALHFRGLMLAAPAAAAPVAAPVAAAPAAASGPDAAALLDRIGELSEAEVADLLRELAQDAAA